MSRIPLTTILVLTLLIIGPRSATAKAALPNIVVMLADDMGFGELRCLNPQRGKIPTPQLDAVAASGMIFTDAHSGSSVCTPTRYGLMTGRYAWRTRLQKGVLTGGASLIGQETLTLAEMLKSSGYHTAVIGKWHLGMKYSGVPQSQQGRAELGAAITHGPIDFGHFDLFCGYHHSRKMEFWVENNKVTKIIKPIDMLPLLTATAVDYIEGCKDRDQPFFLYVPWNAPHSPVVPSQEWQGKSGLNEHADFVMQTDDSYGQVVQALRDNGFYNNTLIICSSDNGTSAGTSGVEQLHAARHFPSGELRGMKSDIWDGGHRVPFLVCWPGQIKAGSRCNDLVCLTDVMATAAELIGYELSASDAVDSFSFLQALKGKNQRPRTDVIHHSISGEFSIRQGDWKFIACPGSGGWSPPRTDQAAREAEAQGLPAVQLYHLQRDIGEQRNLAHTSPEKVAQLRELLDEQIQNGRTTPGPILQNDVPVVVEKWKARKVSSK